MKTPPPVHLESKEPVTRALDVRRGRLLNEPGRPQGKPLLEIIDWCDVEHSPRYARTPSATWCNIYACDVANLFGVYLPHVFWTPTACDQWVSGATVPIKYNETINELGLGPSAGLFWWLVRWGAKYGWQHHATWQEAQDLVNAGAVGVVCAAHPGGIGHISVIVPESEAMKRGPGPVQSQAGAHNYELFTKVWWTAPGYNAGIWTCVPVREVARRSVIDVGRDVLGKLRGLFG